MPQQFHSKVYVLKRNENIGPHKDLYKNIPGSLIQKSLK